MVTYDFYKNIYMGSAIAEASFPQAAARAEEFLSSLERNCEVIRCGPDSRTMAICAMAETIEAYRRSRDVRQASVGGVSVRYEPEETSLQKQLVRSAGVYLDICRGVSG